MFNVVASASSTKSSETLPLSDAIDALGDQSSLLPHILRLCALLGLDSFKFLWQRAAEERLKAEQMRSAEIRRMRAASAACLESHFSAQQSAANDIDTWSMIAAPIPPEPSAPDAEVLLYEACALGSSNTASKRPVARFVMQRPESPHYEPGHAADSRDSSPSVSSTASVASHAAPEFKPATYVAPAKTNARSVSAAVTSTVTSVSSALSGLAQWSALSPTIPSATRADRETLAPAFAGVDSADAGSFDDTGHAINAHGLSAELSVVEDHFGTGLVGGIDLSAASLTASQFYSHTTRPPAVHFAGSGRADSVSGLSGNSSSSGGRPYRPFDTLQHPVGSADHAMSAQTNLPDFPASPPSPSGNTRSEAVFRW